ncbi:MAG TPA: NADH-quinone oxidoreductase subunit M [Anaerolineales bacterium]|nr:NADH-quinone oxidoreductase subunit M [Anaerolineales bacterium]
MDSSFPILSLLTFLPLAGVVILALLPRDRTGLMRWTALLTSLAVFVVSLAVLVRFDPEVPGLQMTERISWFRLAGLDVEYFLGIDGLSILLVLLTTLLMALAIVSTWSAITERVREFMIFFLLLEIGMIGVFLAQDLFLFYVFWEFTLVPMYFLIGMWGGERRIYAAVKFFLYTMAGSILMLLAILWLGIEGGSFSLPDLITAGQIPAEIQFWLFLAFAAAFAIKVPMWPLHSWLPDAHVEAPTAGSVILAGVLLKMGTYGFLRFNIPLFPAASLQLAPWIAGLGVVGILYGAVVSYPQRDVKKLVAYSSVSHLGFVMLGLFALNAQGIQGGVLQMVNHGLSTGALFLIVGMIYERRHTRELEAFGGLWKIMPIYAALTLVVALSSMGLPGLNGFVGEFTILLGSFGSEALGSPWFAGAAVLGVILAAIYILYMFQKMFLGPVTHDENLSLKDLHWREIVTLIPLIILIFWIGLFPAPFFNLMEASVGRLVETVQVAALAAH